MREREGRDWDEDDSPDDMDGPNGENGDDSLSRAEDADLSPLALMSGRALRRLIESVDIELLSMALRDQEASLVERILNNLSSRTAAVVREEIGRPAFEQAEQGIEARYALMETAHALEELGEISFEGPADDAIPPLDAEAENLLSRYHAPEAAAPDAVALLSALSVRAAEYGLLSLEPALERIPDGVFSTGLRMLVDQLSYEEIEVVLERQIESHLEAIEKNAEIAIEGVISIVEGESERRTRARLVAFLPEGEADYERLPGVRFPPSSQAKNDLISLCCELSGLAQGEGLSALEPRLAWIQDSLLQQGLKWALSESPLDEIERLLERRGQTRLGRERRKLEAVYEGFLLLREARPPDLVREALEGFLEERA